MKRIFSIFFALLLAGMAFAAAAEEPLFHEVIGDLGDNHIVTLDTREPVVVTYESDLPEGVTIATVSRPGAASVTIVIQPEETAEGLSLADLDEEQIESFKSIYYDIYADPIITMAETPSGNAFIYVQSNEESDIRSTITLFEGYFIELIQYREDFGALSTNDEDFARELLEGLWIIEAE